MPRFAVLAIGRDRPNIVADVAAVLAAHDCNIENSQMAILAGYFSMVLIAAQPEGADRAALDADLRKAGAALGLTDIFQSDVEDPRGWRDPSHEIIVRGVDRPGVMAVVARVLGDRGINITDLYSVTDTSKEPLCVISLSAALPEPEEPDALQRALNELGLVDEVTLRELD
jgi:predicted amino acid-binding ACT domain protein